MVQHIVRRNRGVSDPQIMHPMREWLIGIIATVIVGVFGSISAAFLYHSYDVLRGTEIAVVATSTPYKTKVVERALVEYREKRENYDVLLNKKVIPAVATTTEVISMPIEVTPEATTPTTTPATATVEFPEAESGETTTVDVGGAVMAN